MSFLKKYLAFQKELANPYKSETNPHFRSAFVPLDKLLDHVKPVLNKHGLILQQFTEEEYLITKVIDIESEIGVTSKYKLSPDKQNLQGQGSARTYIRRYEIETICGVFGDKDDDGNSASDPVNQTPSLLDMVRLRYAAIEKKDAKGLADFFIERKINPSQVRKLSEDDLEDLLEDLNNNF